MDLFFYLEDSLSCSPLRVSKYGISLTIFMNYFFAFEEAYFKMFVNILKYYVNKLNMSYKNIDNTNKISQ